ncbi:unnamed protein product [Auanema sp. JU1783]|nr:unnamed protein product [Auanema sp. JU1783]
MSSVTRYVLLCALLPLIALSAPSADLSSSSNTPVVSCSIEEHIQIPCQCCKKDCWYTVAAAATHELGHMPGEAGEQEALATLKLIRACMISECSAVCSSRRGPF